MLDPHHFPSASTPHRCAESCWCHRRADADSSTMAEGRIWLLDHRPQVHPGGHFR